MSETGIDVYIPEFSGSVDDNSPFRKELESEFSKSFHLVSIGRGWAAAAWVTELVSFAEAYGGYAVGAAIATFFAGEKIEKGLEIWPRLFQRLKSTFHRKPTLDREGAAVLVANEISQRLGEEIVSIRCNGFKVIDCIASGNYPDAPRPMPLGSIGERQPDKVSHRDVYYFDIDVNGRRFLGRVELNDVMIGEVDSNAKT